MYFFIKWVSFTKLPINITYNGIITLISKSELYRKIDGWANEGLLIKDHEDKERNFYSHFVIRKTPQLKMELLSLCDELISLFSKKYKEIADIVRVLGTRRKIPLGLLHFSNEKNNNKGESA